jgi:hypothetical protein
MCMYKVVVHCQFIPVLCDRQFETSKKKFFWDKFFQARKRIQPRQKNSATARIDSNAVLLIEQSTVLSYLVAGF